jgi:hypothetical protein
MIGTVPKTAWWCAVDHEFRSYALDNGCPEKDNIQDTYYPIECRRCNRHPPKVRITVVRKAGK